MRTTPAPDGYTAWHDATRPTGEQRNTTPSRWQCACASQETRLGYPESWRFNQARPVRLAAQITHDPNLAEGVEVSVGVLQPEQ